MITPICLQQGLPGSCCQACCQACLFPAGACVHAACGAAAAYMAGHSSTCSKRPQHAYHTQHTVVRTSGRFALYRQDAAGLPGSPGGGRRSSSRAACSLLSSLTSSCRHGGQPNSHAATAAPQQMRCTRSLIEASAPKLSNTPLRCQTSSKKLLPLHSPFPEGLTWNDAYCSSRIVAAGYSCSALACHTVSSWTAEGSNEAKQGSGIDLLHQDGAAAADWRCRRARVAPSSPPPATCLPGAARDRRWTPRTDPARPGAAARATGAPPPTQGAPPWKAAQQNLALHLRYLVIAIRGPGSDSETRC
jgi:hypothetical protein